MMIDYQDQIIHDQFVELGKLTARLIRLEDAIRYAEWSASDGYGHERCPWCLSSHTHNTDCICTTLPPEVK